MAELAPAPDGMRALELVLATTAPASIDQLVAWDVVRPSELWRFLESASGQGWIARDDAAGPGRFAFRDEARRNQALAAAAPEDWRALFRLDALAAAALEAARAAIRARRLDTASQLYSALVRLAPRDALPGGARGWLDLVGECARVFRIVEWLEPDLLDEALELAVREGDLRLQAVLSGARGFAASRHLQMEEANAWFERALEAAAAVGDPAIVYEVHVQVAFGHVLQGRPRAAIATFERLVGDVPGEYVPLPPEMAHPMNAVPESPLAVLAAMFGQTGQYGRAFEMLHRMRAAGERLGRPDLVATADTFIAGLHAGRRDLDETRAAAEAAFAHWSAGGGEPYYLWHSSASLAWVRASEGRLDEAREILEVGQRARRASGLMYFAGSHLFEALERLEAEGAAPPEGIALDGEIDRMMGWPDVYMRAVAHRYRARRLARAAADPAGEAEIDRLHAAGIAMLREAAPCPIELARSLEERARWAERRGRPDEAARLAAEARAVRGSLGLAPRGTDGASARVAAALVELGRLGSMANRTEGAWGESASRRCAALGAERCALVELAAAGARTLAARGGGPAWVAAVERLAAERAGAGPEAVAPPETREEPAGGAQLLVVPFASERLGRRGWAFLENRRARPLVGPTDAAVLEVLQAQLGVVLENVELWQELTAARRRLEQENRYYRAATPAAAPRGRIVGDSPALREVLGLVEKVAPTATAVLVHGETGVGKELVAREIHRLSARRDAPFIAVHIASLAPGLVASALFGHERGAFTGATEQTKGRFELADGGTLFLDEMGELGAEDQVRLLRVLQEGTFERVGGTKQLRSDFRLIAATNRDLKAEVKAGRFREDLYFRLAAFPLHVPPLRDRTEEIPTLALYFMEAAQRKLAVKFDGIGEADMARLVEYPWPGNVRELEHVIERAALLSEPPRLRIPPLFDDFGGGAGRTARRAEWVTLEESERRYLREVIAHTGGRITGKGGAAELLDVNPSTLNWRIGKLGLKPDLKRARADED
ncbi:MAG TPA: sigma-54 dependent transcriptional regulator [Anaeromyxobacter sp.]|nr:sigma-54 dependent transcriptional regulator [Anaeromyxobacter sp.]